MKHIALGTIILLLLSSVAFPQNSSDDTNETSETPIKTLTEERLETLKYGIDSQVLSTINAIIEEDTDTFNDELLEIFENTINTKIKEKILELYTENGFSGAKDIVLDMVRYWEELESSLLIASVRYLEQFPDEGTREILVDLIKNADNMVKQASISVIGKVGTSADGEILLQLLDDNFFPSSLKPQLILAIGELKVIEAQDRLITILEDETEERSWRWNASAALGKLATPEALAAIKNSLQADDSILRSYAVGALENFEDSEAVPLLIHALRDDFWRVRVSAAKSLGQKESQSAVEILIYKATEDPENPVRIEAIQALGKIGTGKAVEALEKIYTNTTSPAASISMAARMLIQENFAAARKTIVSTIEREWSKEQSQVLDLTCKLLSEQEIENGASLYEKMLTHNSLNLKIYGLRGIRKNNLRLLKEKVENLSTEETHRSIRKVALDILEEWD